MKQDEKKQLDMLKQDYEHIPVPPEARTRMLAGISQAKKEQKGLIIMKFAKHTGGAAAAAMLTITLLANLNPTTASAMEQIPVIGSIAKVVTFRTFEDKRGNYEADIQIPQVTLEDSNQSQVPANKSIEEYANELIAEYNQELEEFGGEGHYSLESSYKVVTDNSKYLSIRFDTTQTMASGAQFVKIFTIDKATGDTVSLTELLKNKPGALEAISSNIKQQMAEQMAADENIVYFYHSDMPIDEFESLSGDESYYFNDKGELVIAFSEYDVAPGYMGAVEFTIPESVCGGFGV